MGTFAPILAGPQSTREKQADAPSRATQKKPDPSPAGRTRLPLGTAASAPESNVRVRLQRKLAIGSSSDPLEHEADLAADTATGSHTFVTRRLYAPPVTDAPPIVGRVLRSPGQALDQHTRAWAEPAFQRDFSRVRIHRGPEAEQSAASVQAHAYTVGSSIVFGPDSARSGPQYRRLVAHELAHVVQQGEAQPLRAPLETAPRSSAHITPQPRAANLLQRYEDTRKKDLGWKEELLVSTAAAPAYAVGGAAHSLVHATWHGFIAEVDVSGSEAKDKVKDRLSEFIRSPKQLLMFFPRYWWGLIKGVFSPITGLFDLGKLAVHLEEIGRKVLTSAWEHSDQLANGANDLALKMRDLGKKSLDTMKGYLLHPIDSVIGLLPLLDEISDQAMGAAEEGGHKIATTLLNATDQPIPDLAETAGEVIGTVVVNVALFVLTDGVGDAIVQIAGKLGELGTLLSKFGKGAQMLGKLAEGIGSLLGRIGGWVVKLEALIARAAGVILKPLAPLLEKFGEAMGSLRTFLRDLLGIAEKAEAQEAAAAAKALAQQAEKPHAPAAHEPAPTPAKKPAAAPHDEAPAKPAQHAPPAEEPHTAPVPTKPTPVKPAAKPRPSAEDPAPRAATPGDKAGPGTKPKSPPAKPKTLPRKEEEIPWADDVDLAQRGLKRADAFHEYGRWIRQDPLREAAVFRDLKTGEFIVVQGDEGSVGLMKELQRDSNWSLVEHYHPGGDPLARIASSADYRVMMQGQLAGKVPRGVTSTRIRWIDPDSGVEKLTEIGFRPGRPDPYYIKFQELDGKAVEVTFKTEPWKGGSDYEDFLRTRFANAKAAVAPAAQGTPSAKAPAAPQAPAPKAPDTHAPAPPETATPPRASTPRRPAPARPVQGSGPAPQMETAPGIVPEPRTAQTGGIEKIKEGRDVFGNKVTDIEGELKPGMHRPTAKNYNKEWLRKDLGDDVAAALTARKGLSAADAKAAGEALAKNYEAAHLWGPGFGDEAAAGMMWAPTDVNQMMQNRFAEKFARELYTEAAAAGGTVRMSASAVPYERSVLLKNGLPPRAEFLEHAQYKITVTRPNLPPEEILITVKADLPGPHASGSIELFPPSMAERFFKIF